MTKQEMIDSIIKTLQTEFHGRDSVVTERDREFLKNSTVAWLENKLRDLQQQVVAKRHQQQIMSNPEIAAIQEERRQIHQKIALIGIYKTVIGNRVASMCEANDGVILGWLHPGEFPSIAWFKNVLAEQPALGKQLVWDSADVFDPVKRKRAEARQLEQDKETFANICRRNSLSECEANFNLWRNTDSISGLAPASPQELAEFREERIEQHNEDLLRIAETDPSRLRTIVKQEAADARGVSAQVEAEKALAASKVRDAAMGGFPLLPADITCERIKNAAADKIKFLMRRYGNYQINTRLAGREN